MSQQATDAVYGLKGTGKAFLASLKSEQSALDAEMARLGDTIGKELAKWFHVPASKLPNYGGGGKKHEAHASPTAATSATPHHEPTLHPGATHAGGGVTVNIYGAYMTTAEQIAHLKRELAMATG